MPSMGLAGKLSSVFFHRRHTSRSEASRCCCCAGEEARSRKLGRRSGTGQLAGSNFVLDALVEGETVAEVLQSAQHQASMLERPLSICLDEALASSRIEGFSSQRKCQPMP